MMGCLRPVVFRISYKTASILSQNFDSAILCCIFAESGNFRLFPRQMSNTVYITPARPATPFDVVRQRPAPTNVPPGHYRRSLTELFESVALFLFLKTAIFHCRQVLTETSAPSHVPLQGVGESCFIRSVDQVLGGTSERTGSTPTTPHPFCLGARTESHGAHGIVLPL